jgi:uncharacterized protein (TIGR01244 family)
LPNYENGSDEMKRQPVVRIAAILGLFGLLGGTLSGQSGEKKNADKLRPEKCGNVKNLHVLGKLYFAGQPAKEDFPKLKQLGVKTVVNLREAEELKFDEAAVLRKLGLEYHHIPFSGAETLTDKVFEQTRRLFKDESKHPMLVHCASANRVGAVWLAHRVLDDGVSYNKALEEAKEIGLSKAGLEKKAKEYIDRKKK